MITDKRQIESRIRILEDQNRAYKKELSMVHPIIGISPRGKMKNSLLAGIYANENEIKTLRMRLQAINDREAERIKKGER